MNYKFYYPSINDLLIDLNVQGILTTMYPNLMNSKGKLVEDVKNSSSRPPSRNIPGNLICVQDIDELVIF